MNRENSLFEACRILFGADIVPSRDFLVYLREEGIASAFRKRAMEIHPDKALASGLSIEKCQEEFVALQIACETLRRHIASQQIQSQVTRSPDVTPTSVPPYPYALPEKQLLFGRFLYHVGVIQWSQIIKALTWQKSGRLKMGELGVSLGYLDRNSVGIILKNSKVNGVFGLTARKLGLLTGDEVRELLRRQKRQQKRIGQFFVENGVLSRAELNVLLEQCREHNRLVQRISDR